MGVRIYYDKDIDASVLNGKTVAVVGYGSQGHAHAQNLRDSGCNVIIGSYTGSRSGEAAKADGFEVLPNAEATRRADIISVLLPDTKQAQIYNDEIKPNLSAGKLLLFSHGFTIHYEQIVPPPEVDVVMIAPKGPGHRLRALYQQDQGIPCLIAVHQDPSGNAEKIALAYGKGIGGGRAGIMETTFREETETDLFGEQAVLVGGLIELIKNGYEVLIEGGYQPESAYFEVLHELKLIIDLVYQGGLGKMLWSISDTAEYGAYSQGPQVIDSSVKDNMRKVLKEIQDGSFARKWIAENDEGRHEFNRLRKENTEHEVEGVGEKLRAMMIGLDKTI